MRVARAEMHEIPIVLTFIDALLAELGGEGEEFDRIDRDKLFRDIREDLEREAGTIRFIALLARDRNDVPLGVVTLSPGFAAYAGGEYGILQEMYVLPAHRGRGVGRALVAAAVAYARERRWFRIDVTCPQDDAGEAEKFYDAVGFELAGRKLRLLV